MDATPTAPGGHLYHLVAAADFRRDAAAVGYRPPSLHGEGFVHCSASPEQTLRVARAFYANVEPPLLVLQIDAAKLSAPLHMEPAAAVVGERLPAAEGALEYFPHVYGAIDLVAIVGVGVLAADFGWPSSFGRLSEYLG